VQQHHGYNDVLLADAEGEVRLSLSGCLDPLHPDAARTLAEAFRTRRVVLTDLHFGSTGDVPHMAAIAPLWTESEGDPAPLGAVLLQSDARQFLYPLIQSWPTTSASAETLLVRQDGEAVLFLNELRHQRDTALRLRIPISRRDVSAVMAVLGREGVVQSRDYRGVDVFSDLRAIPDSSWFLVTKIDSAEALEVLQRESTLILMWLAACAVSSATAVGLIWVLHRNAHFRELFLAEAARRKIEERYRTTLLSIGDGVIATDSNGHVEFANPVAEELTGWPQQEACGKPLEEVFVIVKEDSRQPVESPVHRVIREGTVARRANQALLIARDGVERPIANSGAPIRGDQGEISGAVLVFHDQTQERAARRALQESAAELAAANESLAAARRTALNAMDDAIEDRRRAEQANQALLASLKEKEILLKEVHHRVKNNLQVVASLISLQSFRTQDPQVLEALSDTQDRIRSMSLLHEVLYRSKNLARLDFPAYVQELCSHLIRSSGTANVRVRIEYRLAPVHLTLERAVPCGLLINELVSNSLKHGFPGQRYGCVTVEVRPDQPPDGGKVDGQPRRLVIIVSDDGVGLPDDLEQRRQKSLGLKLVHGLAGQLGGQLTILQRETSGAAFRVDFSEPLEADEHD
jgi:PAS domain S-box-containing protein